MKTSCLEGIKEINNRELFVNPTYHSNPDPRVIQYLADNFNPLLYTPIKVVYRDGKYFIVDGVHIREALVKLKGTDDFPILCRVFTGLSVEDEAQLYSQLHDYNEPSLSYTDKLRAMYYNLRDYGIVAHVHDEVICDVSKDVAVEEVEQIMSQAPPWAEGLVIRGEGYSTQWYCKD